MDSDPPKNENSAAAVDGVTATAINSDSCGNVLEVHSCCNDGPVAIFLDLETCPLLKNAPLKTLVSQIKTKLRSNHIRGPISRFCLYGNSTSLTWWMKMRCQWNGLRWILVVPEGRSVRECILDDIIRFATRTPPPANIFLASGDKKFSRTLYKLGYCRYTIISAMPSGVFSSLDAFGFAGDYIWEWPTLTEIPRPDEPSIAENPRRGKSRTKKDHMIDTDLLKDVTSYSRPELEVACEGFSNIIGSSSDSIVYKGNMKDGPEIAVISFNQKEHWTSHLELYFQKEVADLARLNHENISKLMGYCIEGVPFTRMLVFEYASNGTLSENLHYEEGCQPLSWTRRMMIIEGISKGLKYLHTEIEPPFTIFELNSSAVYLTEDFSPKLVDFESWKTILTRSENNSSTVSNEDAMCVQPSSLQARHLDIHGNIYSFGVLLLEIVTGLPLMRKDKGFLVDWAKDYLEDPEKMASVVDPALKQYRMEDFEAIREVVRRCIHARPGDKVSMQDLCATLESKLDTSGSSASSLAWVWKPNRWCKLY